jgi:flagellar protein FlaG
MKIGDAMVDVEVKAQRAAEQERRAVALPKAAASPAPVQDQGGNHRPPAIPKIESVTRQIDSFLRSINRSLDFRLDEATGQMVVTLRDSSTGEVIRQIPGEEALRIAARIESGLSLMLDEQA